MGGKKRSSSSKSFFAMLFGLSRRTRYRDVEEESPKHINRIFPSDEDRGRWVGEPDIDRKATEFITRFHEARFSDIQTIQASNH